MALAFGQLVQVAHNNPVTLNNVAPGALIVVTWQLDSGGATPGLVCNTDLIVPIVDFVENGSIAGAAQLFIIRSARGGTLTVTSPAGDIGLHEFTGPGVSAGVGVGVQGSANNVRTMPTVLVPRRGMAADVMSEAMLCLGFAYRGAGTITVPPDWKIGQSFNGSGAQPCMLAYRLLRAPSGGRFNSPFTFSTANQYVVLCAAVRPSSFIDLPDLAGGGGRGVMGA